jgi:hypothetical protein
MKKPQATKKSSIKPPLNRRLIPNFADIARMVTGSEPPRWLPAHLEWWAQGIRHDILVDQYRPSKLQTAERLLGIEKAVAVLRRELEEPSIRNLLMTAKMTKRIGISISDLKDLSERAAIVRSSPPLIGKTGKTKRGQGKPDVPDVFSAKTLCAARVLELGRFLNRFEPGVKSINAAAIAQAYWLASGGTSKSSGNPLNGWKHHFKLAKDNAGSIGLKRLIWWRDLSQCQQRGRPPWFLGTYFPVPEAEIRSASGV